MREMTIAEFARKYILEDKVFIVPTRRIGLLMVNDMARSGASALNLDPMTIKRLSEEICQRYIEENNILIIDDILGKSIVLDLLKTLNKTEEGFFFRESLIDERTAQEVYKVIMELKSKHIFDFPREKDLDKIYGMYESKLKELNAMDYVDIMLKAIEVEEIDVFKDKKIAVAANIEFHNVERKLFEQLSKDAVKIKMPVKNLVDSPKEYFFKENIESLDSNRKISFFNEYGVRNEIKYIIDDIVKKEIPLDEVVVAYTDGKYIGPINLEFQKAGLAINFSDGLDILSSTSYRFIKSIFEFAQNYYNIKFLKPIFFNDSLNIKIDKEEITSHSIYEELILCKVFYGRENYDRLNFIPENIKADSRIKREWIREFFRDLLFTLPEEKVDFKSYIKKLEVLIKKYVKLPDKGQDKSYDTTAMESILERLRTMEAIPLKVSRGEYFDIVLSYLEEISIYRKGANPSKVFACKYSTAGYTGRSHLYLIGLDSDTLANKMVESPILLDNIRKDISLSLSFSKESYRYKKYKIKEALTSNFKAISVGYSNFDMMEVKAKTPSKIYTELKDEYGHEDSFIKKPKRLLGKDLVSSATALDTLGQCSRKLYLQKGLGLKEKEDIEVDLDRWLDALDKGSLVHEVLNRYFDLPESGRDDDVLLNIIEELCQEKERETPYILKEVYKREKEEIRSFCRAIVKREKTNGLEVFLNELSFGGEKENRTFGTLKKQRVTIGDVGLSVFGAIDRIDIDRAKKIFKIVDYKTGNLKSFEKRLRTASGRGKNKVFDYSEGQRFQFYIYKKALENIIKLDNEYKDYRVESFSYEFKDDVINIEFDPQFIGEIEARIKALLQIDIFENDKAIIYDEDDTLTCKYCEFKNICASDKSLLEVEGCED